MNQLRALFASSDYSTRLQFPGIGAVLLISSLTFSTTVTAQSLGIEVADELMPDVSNYSASLNLNSDYGAYDSRQIQPLDELGRELMENGNFFEAVAVYQQALHLTRINYGLYHESQIPLLDSLIETEIATENWTSVDEHYGYMEHLYRRIYPMDDPRLENGLQKVVEWHVSASNVNLNGERLEHLRHANEIYKLRLEIARRTLEADHPKMLFLQANILMVERQLIFASQANRESIQREQRRRTALFADLD